MPGEPGTDRTIVYIDGFNLYFGALKGTPNRWLDLSAYFRQLLPHADIAKIRYFTAVVAGRAKRRQASYLSALGTLPGVEVQLGKFKRTTVKCGVQACSLVGDREFDKPEEKRTDVNIAIWMLDDALNSRCERMELVSGDSDLVPAVEAVRRNFPSIHTRVYVPAQSPVRGAARELRGSAHTHRTLPLELLPRSQLPEIVWLPDGTNVSRPTEWL